MFNWISSPYCQIVRDEKLKFEAQLSLIGGTMGLLTGFSIISAVEILVFLIKLFVRGILAQTKTSNNKIVK